MLRDRLTGLPNSRAFQDRFTELTAVDATPGLALLLLDVDGFRQINEQLGDEQGDQALRVVADALRDQLRAGDLPARLGGDEFAVLLPSLAPDDARLLPGRLQQHVNRAPRWSELTVSIGIVWFAGDRRLTKLNADAALYRAKTNGRSLVCIADPQAESADLILGDLLMPTPGGYELVQALRDGSRTGGIPDAFSTATRAVEEVRRLANAFLQQGATNGGALLAVDAPRSPLAAGSWLRDVLSPRELEVLEMVAEGESNAEIASRLVVEGTTVQSHVKHILRKLGARNRTEAAGHYLRN